MRTSKALYALLTAASGVFMLLGWQLLLMGSTLSPLPFGAFPSIVIAAMMTSTGAFAAFAVLCALLYGMVFTALYFAWKRKPWAVVAGTLLYCLDMAAALVFTAFSWWFLLGIAVDVVLIVMLWRMYVLAGKQTG